MKIEKMRKIADARINSDDDSVRAVDVLSNMSNELAFQKMIDEKIDKLLDVVEAAKEIKSEIDCVGAGHLESITDGMFNSFVWHKLKDALEALEKE